MTYELKSDGQTLTEPSSKKFLEDLLMSVRHTLERKRRASNSSVSSISSLHPLETSTPQRKKLTSIDEDMK
jgi:hypothetical protein